MRTMIQQPNTSAGRPNSYAARHSPGALAYLLVPFPPMIFALPRPPFSISSPPSARIMSLPPRSQSMPRSIGTFGTRFMKMVFGVC
jgi:hypothetical protein